MKSAAATSPHCPRSIGFATIQAMDVDAKGRLLALLVARQINGGEPSGSRRDRRHQRFDQIAFAAGVDMVSKWQAPVAFYGSKSL